MTCLVVFHKPPGLGELGIVRVSMCECATGFGTLNSRISRVGHDLGWNVWLILAIKWPA